MIFNIITHTGDFWSPREHRLIVSAFEESYDSDDDSDPEGSYDSDDIVFTSW